MVSYKAATDVDHISSELCLLGCHISTGKPQRGCLRAFLLGNGTSWIFSRGCGVSHSRTPSTQYLQHGPHLVRGFAQHFPAPSLPAPSLAQGGPWALALLQLWRSCIALRLASVFTHTHGCCPLAERKEKGDWKSFTWAFLSIFFNPHVFLLPK